MDRERIVGGVLALIEGEAHGDCRKLAMRFRKALQDANPDLPADAFAVYDTAFRNEIANLAGAARAARVRVAIETLTDEQIAQWRELLDMSFIRLVFQSIRDLAPHFRQATQEVFAKEGVAAHTRSAEKLFESFSNRPGDDVGFGQSEVLRD